MKSTGIVRQMDSLGRIVLPIELRRTLDIAQKDSLEIYVDESAIILKKYQPSCVFCNNAKDVDVSKLAGENEHELIKQLSLLPEEIRLAARDYDPSRINRYLVELASRFHRFYNSERIKGAEPEVLSARLKLADSVRSVIAAALGILGVTAPEKM